MLGISQTMPMKRSPSQSSGISQTKVLVGDLIDPTNTPLSLHKFGISHDLAPKVLTVEFASRVAFKSGIVALEASISVLTGIVALKFGTVELAGTSATGAGDGTGLVDGTC